ncbi:hypothetical protein HOY80DRAFT_104654 [Tuber brumale]|nr:hypothetical protein HOY80DRAFT_104654 [Tuber brumale]
MSSFLPPPPWLVVNGVLAVPVPGFFFCLLFPFHPSGPYATDPVLAMIMMVTLTRWVMGDHYSYHIYSKFPTLLLRKKISKLNPLPQTHIQRILHSPIPP